MGKKAKIKLAPSAFSASNSALGKGSEKHNCKCFLIPFKKRKVFTEPAKSKTLPQLRPIQHLSISQVWKQKIKSKFERTVKKTDYNQNIESNSNQVNATVWLDGISSDRVK